MSTATVGLSKLSEIEGSDAIRKQISLLSEDNLYSNIRDAEWLISEMKIEISVKQKLKKINSVIKEAGGCGLHENGTVTDFIRTASRNHIEFKVSYEPPHAESLQEQIDQFDQIEKKYNT